MFITKKRKRETVQILHVWYKTKLSPEGPTVFIIVIKIIILAHNFSLQRLELSLTCIDHIILPDYSGAVIRLTRRIACQPQ
jgi:hypothetical protein